MNVNAKTQHTPVNNCGMIGYLKAADRLKFGVI